MKLQIDPITMFLSLFRSSLIIEPPDFVAVSPTSDRPNLQPPMPPRRRNRAPCFAVFRRCPREIDAANRRRNRGLCEDTRVRDLPFPQNRILTITTKRQGENSRTYRAPAIFIPVLDKPLSSNLYYVIVAKGRKKGKANTSSREEDMTTCCFCRCVNDVDPSDFDPDDAYQVFEIIPKRGRFTAKSLAPDGFAPWLMRKQWKLHASRPKDFELAEAAGLDKALRASMPPLTAASIGETGSKNTKQTSKRNKKRNQPRAGAHLAREGHRFRR